MDFRDPRIPALPTLHPLGHLPALRRDLLQLQRRIAEERDVVRVRLGAMRAVWLSSPAAVYEVLQGRAEDYEKSQAFTRILRPITGDGLLASQGSRYRRRRNLVAPAFAAARLGRHVGAIVAETDRCLDDLARQSHVDVGRQMMQLTLQVVTSTLLCTRVDADIRSVEHAVSRGSEAFSEMLRSPIPLPPGRWHAPGRKLDAARRDLDRVVYRVMAERRRSDEDPGDVLSILLGARDAETGEGLSDEELRDEVMTLLLAGHETTANALTWSLQLLATHPDAARKLAAEVDEVLQGRPPAFEDLPRLPYTASVFKEALRLYPPAFLVGRRALTSSRIGSYRVASGETIFCNIYGIHHRADLFPEPDRFLPERFLDQAEKHWPKGAYLPFSLGPRVCVGNHFAMMEAQLVLARFAQRLQLSGSITELAPAEPLVTLRPAGTVSMRVRLREARPAGARASVPAAS